MTRIQLIRLLGVAEDALDFALGEYEANPMDGQATLDNLTAAQIKLQTAIRSLARP